MCIPSLPISIVFFNTTASVGGPTKVAKVWGDALSKIGYSFHYIVGWDRYNISDLKSNMTFESEYNNSLVKQTYQLWHHLRYYKNSIFVFNKSTYTLSLLIIRLLCPKISSTFVYYMHGGTSDFKVVYNNLNVLLMSIVYTKFIALIDDYSEFDTTRIKFAKYRKLFDLLTPSFRQNLYQRTTIIPNPLDYYPNFTSNPKNKVVITVCRLDRVKGLDLLLEAWKIVTLSHNDWKLIIVGDGQERSELLKKLSLLEINTVEFVGEQQDVYKFYNAASIYISSSREEAMSVSILEAMSCGLPVITTPTVGGNFLVKNLRNGICLADFEPTTIASGISYLIYHESIRAEYGHASRVIANEYSVDIQLDKFLKVLKCQ